MGRFEPESRPPIRWCLAYERGPDGEHRCKLRHDIMSMCAFGRHGIRFTMPCSDDVKEGYPKGSCDHFQTPEGEILKRARQVRANRVRCESCAQPLARCECHHLGAELDMPPE